MKQKLTFLLAALMALTLTACGGQQTESTKQVADESDMAQPQDVVQEGMEPVTADALKDGEYTVTVDSSSSMFQVTACTLTVKDGTMTAQMTMGGTGYQWIYPGTGEEAAAAPEEDYIPFQETASGEHTFTLPVEALDQGIPCAAFSKRKEMWYDRTLVFRADSLPQEAFAQGTMTTAADLGLTDGEYQVAVSLTGGSGRSSVASPARLTIQNGQVTATLIWSSANYEYMKVDGKQYLPENTEGNATFTIPVAGFDRAIPVQASTTAMSTPHEIDYTLTFDSATLEPVA